MVQQWRGAGDSLDLSTISGTTLLQTDYAQRQEVVKEVLPAGCTLLAGNAKEGKSLLAYHVAACVATGQPFLQTFPVQQGQVLFFALEDGEMRGQARLRMQQEQLGLTASDLGGVHCRFWDAPRLGSGFERFIEQWIATYPDTRLIIIDILEKIRPRGGGWQDLYQEGYEATAPLARLAQEKNIALLVVHHSTKNPHTDPRLRVSGPMSLLGGADNAWLLSRPYGETEAELTIAGRDLAEQEWLLHFEQGLWSLVGPLKEQRLSHQRQEVLELLAEEPTGLRPYQLAQALGKNPSTTRSLLKKMRQDGEVVLEEGLYRAGVHAVHAVAPDSPPPEPAPAVDTGSESSAGTPQEKPPAQSVDTGNSVDAIDSVDTTHREDSSNGLDTVDAGNNGHRGNSVDSDDTANTEDRGNTVDSGDTTNRENSDNSVDTLEEDPFLAPDPYTSLPMVPVSEEEPAERDPPWIESRPALESHPVAGSAQLSTPAQEGTIQEGEWFWPLLPGGAKHSQSPWQAVEIKTMPNGIVMVYGQVSTGKLHHWRLQHCLKADPPPGEK